MRKLIPIKMLAFAIVAGLGGISPLSADEEETPLAKEMDELSGSLKGLRKAKTWEDRVKLAQNGQKATLASLKYLPVIFKDIKDEKKKAVSTADYKRLIGLTYAGLCELEAAFLEENQDKADDIISKLKMLKKEAHKKYTE